MILVNDGCVGNKLLYVMSLGRVSMTRDDVGHCA